MYTYALLKPSVSSLEMPKGIAGEVQLIGTPELVAAVEPDFSEADLKQLEQDDEKLMQAVLSHDRVIQCLFQQTTILPLRFGIQFASRQVLLSHLEAQQQEYLEALFQFEGKAECSLVFEAIAAPEAEIAPEITGKSYFLAKKEQYQTQADYQRRQQQELATLLQQINQYYPQITFSQNQTGAKKVYLLIDRTEAETLAQQIQDWQQQINGWNIALSEPHPPYRFLKSST
jgi:hypothetical protein